VACIDDECSDFESSAASESGMTAITVSARITQSGKVQLAKMRRTNDNRMSIDLKANEYVVPYESSVQLRIVAIPNSGFSDAIPLMD
jgi:hypothetical protein